MIRALISLVFVFSLVVASITHANAAPNLLALDLQARATSSATTDGVMCSKTKAILSQSDFASCMIEAENTRTAPRCQIDLAPIVYSPLLLDDGCSSIQHEFNHPVPAEWQSQPVLGPPKLA